MRVIALRDSYFNDGEPPNGGKLTTEKAICKGSIYHVVNKTFDNRPFIFLDTNLSFPYGVWFYELLEQRGKHCHALFLELPDEYENEIAIKEELEKIK